MNTIYSDIDGTEQKLDGYIERCCPTCGYKNENVQGKIKSKTSATDLSFSELQSQWNGFFKEKSLFRYVVCKKCGLMYAPEYFDEKQLSRLYSEMPANMDEVPRSALIRTQSGYFKTFSEFSSLKGNMLEIGPDIGLFTMQCVEYSSFSKYWLLEPNISVTTQLSEVVSNKDYLIINDMFGFDRIPSESVDATVMIHVLDHLLDPKKALGEIRRTMKKGATILIVTHNQKSLLARVLGVKWPAYCLQHPQIYSPKSITTALKEAGFEVVAIKKTKNYFKINFLLKHLMWVFGFRFKAPELLEDYIIGLALGNMITIAKKT